MTDSRYSNRQIVTNRSERYRNVLKNRGLSQITQYATPKYITLDEDLREFVETEIAIWQIGDKFFKLANEHYGDPTLWWIIASFNLAPTEAHLDIGDTIYIPINWQMIYDYVRK